MWVVLWQINTFLETSLVSRFFAGKEARIQTEDRNKFQLPTFNEQSRQAGRQKVQTYYTPLRQGSASHRNKATDEQRGGGGLGGGRSSDEWLVAGGRQNPSGKDGGSPLAQTQLLFSVCGGHSWVLLGCWWWFGLWVQLYSEPGSNTLQTPDDSFPPIQSGGAWEVNILVKCGPNSE